MTDKSSALAQVPPAQSIYQSGDSFALAQRMAQSLAASSIVPDSYRGQQGLANCLVALEIANRLGTSPLMVMQNMQVVHGRPVWSSSFLIGLINSSGRYSPLRFAYDNPENPSACYAYATDLRTGEQLRGSTITMAMAQSEGWLGRKGSKWQTMPAQMLMYRAASFWARMYASDLTLGIRLQDEVVDIEEVRVATEPEGVAPLSQAAQQAISRAETVRTLAEIENAVAWVDRAGLPQAEAEAITEAIQARAAHLAEPLSPAEVAEVAGVLAAHPDNEAAFRRYFNLPEDRPIQDAGLQRQHYCSVMSKG